MKKEIIFAIAAGGILGLVITFGIYRANIALKPQSEAQNQESVEGAVKSPEKLDLVISSPDDQSVLTQNKVTVSAATQPNSWVVFSGEENDKAVLSDNQGTVQAEVDLSGGINQVKVTVFDKNGKSIEKSIVLVYSTQLPEPSKEDDTMPASTGAGSDAVREKVAQKLKEVSQKNISYIGSVTDITDTTIQITSYNTSEVKQISIDKDTTDFADTTSENKDSVFEDLAIGDFIVAMGYKNGQEVLKAQRILISPVITENKLVAVMGTVSEVESKNKMAIKEKGSGNERTINFAKKWTGPNLKDLDKDQEVIIVGQIKDDNSLDTARSIFTLDQTEE